MNKIYRIHLLACINDFINRSAIGKTFGARKQVHAISDDVREFQVYMRVNIVDYMHRLRKKVPKFETVYPEIMPKK